MRRCFISHRRIVSIITCVGTCTFLPAHCRDVRYHEMLVCLLISKRTVWLFTYWGVSGTDGVALVRGGAITRIKVNAVTQAVGTIGDVIMLT